MTRRVLVTGSRDWTDDRVWLALDDQLRIAQENNEPLMVVHGAARGADTLAHEWVLTHQAFGDDVDEDPHSADWNRYGKAAGPIRNSVMVKKGAAVCLAFPLPGSIGTLDCMEKAERAKIPVKDLGRNGDQSVNGRPGQG